MFPRIDKGPIEYHLDIRQAWDSKEQKEGIRFLFETEEEFHHFKYEISIDVDVKKQAIAFTLKGLTTKGVLLPETGRARSEVFLHGLRGPYSVTVTKPGMLTNAFGIDIGTKSVSQSKQISAERQFIDVTTLQ